MSTATILIIAAVFLAGLALGAFIIWVALSRRKPVGQVQITPAVKPEMSAPPRASGLEEPSQSPPLVFRWRFVIAPTVLAAACVVTAAAFAAFLPGILAYRFNSDGTVRATMSAGTFVILMLAAQVICAGAGWAIARIVIKMGSGAFKTSLPLIPLDGYITLMSNMILMPQAILAYVMLNAFIYGVWTRRLIPVTTFAILAITIGTLLLIYFFIRLLSRAQNIISKL